MGDSSIQAGAGSPKPRKAARLIVDTDAHYYENPRAFGQYLDEPWRTRLERWTGLYYAPVAAASRTHDVHLGGRMKRKDLGLPVTDCRDGAFCIALIDIGNDNLAAARGNRPRDRFPDTRGPSCDNRDFACEILR